MLALLTAITLCQNSISDAHGAHRKKGVFCRRCGSKVTTTAHHHNVPASSDTIRLLPEVADGAELSRHRNPSSMSFDVVTFKSVTNVITEGKPQKAQSFFPPYRWEPIFCEVCGAHIGWRFVAKRNPKDMTCPLNLELPPLRPPDLSGSSQPDLAAATNLRDEVDRVSTSDGISSKPTGTSRERQPRASSLIAGLKGFCATKQTGYWIYEWCYKKHVRQFHLEPFSEGASIPAGSKIVSVSGTKYIKNPDWSLGEWAPGAHKSKKARKPFLWPDTRQKGSTKEPKFVSHLHLGGQRCDETDDSRRTEVRLLCCSKEKKTIDKAKDQTGSNPKLASKPEVWNGISMRSLEETSTCRYRIEVCVPSLCKRDDFRPKSMPKPKPTANDQIRDKISDLNQSRKRCSFFGLIWDRLLLQDSPSYKWIASAQPVTGIRRER